MTVDPGGDRSRSQVATLLAQAAVDEQLLRQLLGPMADTTSLLRGSRLPDVDEATILGAYLGVPPSVLVGQTPTPITASLRMGALEGVDDVASVVDHASKLVKAIRLAKAWGTARPSTSLADVPICRNGYAKDEGSVTARRFRAFLALGPTEPVDDAVALIESLGYPVEHRPMPTDVHGLTLRERDEGQPVWVILVNSADAWGRQRYTLAHELCHILYDDDGQLIVERAEPGDRLQELRAESFAHELLLPRAGIKEVVEQFSPLRNLASVQRVVAEVVLRFGASRDAAVIALSDLAPKHWLDTCARGSVRALMESAGRLDEWESLVRDYSVPAPSPTLTEQILHAFSQRLVSLETVADVIADGSLAQARALLQSAGWSDFAPADVG